jgi:hypothetical protein
MFFIPFTLRPQGVFFTLQYKQHKQRLLATAIPDFLGAPVSVTGVAYTYYFSKKPYIFMLFMWQKLFIDLMPNYDFSNSRFSSAEEGNAANVV